MSKVLLVDGHSILNRAFYGVPDLTNSKGLHTNAIYGFLNILFKVLEEEKPECITVAFDVKHPTFRHEMYSAYKGTRKPMPQELHEQVPVLKDILKSMNVTVIECPGYEADDILGTISRIGENAGYDVTIVSGDRDLLQLVTDKVTVRIPKTKGGKTVVEDYTPQKVMETYSIRPKQIIDLKGLMGDSSDNIPGLPGVGEKTATSLLLQYETLEQVIAHAEEVKPKKAREALINSPELALMSKELATIKTDCELDYDIEKTIISDMFNKDAYIYIKEMEFSSMLSRFSPDACDNEDNDVEYLVCDNISELSDNIKNDMAADFVWDGDKLLAMTACDMEDDRIYILLKDNDSFEEDVCSFIKEIIAKEKNVLMYDVKHILKLLDIKEGSFLKDMSVAAYLINPIKDAYDAVSIARDYLGKNIPEYSELFGKKKIKQVLEEDREDCLKYMAVNCKVLKDSYSIVMSELEKMDMLKLYEDIELPLIYTLNNMEMEGVRVNKDELADYGESLTGRIRELEKEIYERAGEKFNINSPKQLGVILFEKLKLPYAKKTKTGYSTSADILEKLRIEDKIVPDVLEYRQLTKLKSTYADGLAAYIGEDGRIHGKFNQTVTATGRISSTEPNLQNIPIRMELGRQIRKVFVPDEGCVFLDADYSQIELRVLAAMSGDESLIQAYNDNMDVHSTTASKVFGVPIEEVTPELRRKAKAVNFGIVYGISSFGLGQDLDISKKEADEYIKKYFETYPKVKEYIDGLVESAKETGYSKTWFGRRRPIPELSSSNFMQRSFGERVAMNAPIQGTAADIIKIAMINVDRKLRKENMNTRLILQVHDELILEAPKEEAGKAALILNEEMVNAVNMSVKMVADVSEGNNWYEAK